MERLLIREEYLECLNTLKVREGFAVASMTGHSRLIFEFGIEPDMAKAITSFWASTVNDRHHVYALSGSSK
jgi:hypothetical protein